MIQRTTRYFAVQPDQCKDFKTVFTPDNDLLPLSELSNCKQLCTLSDGRILLDVLLGPNEIQDMQEMTELQDPLTLDGVATLGLTSSYIGMSREDVFSVYPELEGTETVTYTDPETGEEVSREVPKLPYHEWA
jgi:hypothetical protein